MLDALLLATKFYVPPMRPDCVLREQLVERLDAGVQQGQRLTLVSAPVGFGKTTLVATWLRDRREREPSAQIAWLSLDDDDNDLMRFLTYLAAALERTCPGIGAQAQVILESSHTSGFKPVLTALINAMTGTGMVLVLDDYHVIEDPSVHAAVAFLVENALPFPQGLHVMIVSRVDPPLPLPRLRARHQITEIRAVDLRFTSGETAQLFREALAFNLPDEVLDALEARTEGWIAGLQLAALSLRGCDARQAANFVAEFGGSHRHIIDYLADEVLARQSPDVYDFLCRTALLERLSAPLCRAVTGRADSETLLRQLEQDNVFLVPLDDERCWYRYHRLFADFLRNRLQHILPDQVQDLHLRAAAWHEQQGMLLEAIAHALAAHSFEHAADLIEQVSLALLARSQASMLLHWLQALPDALLASRPALEILYAEALLVTGAYRQIESHLRAVEVALGDDVTSPEARGMRSALAGIRAYSLVVYQGDLRRGSELARRALDDLPAGDDFLRSVVLWLLGFGLFFSPDMNEAQRAFDETFALGQATGNVLISTLSVFISGYLYVLQGKLRRAKITFEQNLKSIETETPSPGLSSLPSLPVSVCLIYQGLGEVLRETNALEEAERVLERGVALAEQWGNAEVLVDSYVVLSRIRQARGDEEGARRAMEAATAFVRRRQVSPFTVRQIKAYQARLWLAQGDVDAAARWAVERARVAAQDAAGSSDVVFYVRWIETSTLARLYLRQRRFDAVSDLLAPLLHDVEALGWGGAVIEVRALEALALYGQGETDAALSKLCMALEAAEPEGYVRVFVDWDASMVPLLREAKERGLLPGYVQHLLDAAGERVVRTTAAPTSSALADPLSERELEVLRLIAQGYTNPDIASKLYVALSTVKTHVNHIYRKLDVSNRVEAVTKVNNLNLLS